MNELVKSNIKRKKKLCTSKQIYNINKKKCVNKDELGLVKQHNSYVKVKKSVKCPPCSVKNKDNKCICLRGYTMINNECVSKRNPKSLQCKPKTNTRKPVPLPRKKPEIIYEINLNNEITPEINLNNEETPEETPEINTFKRINSDNRLYNRNNESLNNISEVSNSTGSLDLNNEYKNDTI
jgi:hypothetical protein